MAVLNINVKRGLQTLAVTCYGLVVIMGPTSYFFFGYVIFYTNLYWVPLVYLAYCYSEREIPSRGGRTFMWVRRWKWWVYFRDYFPMKLVKTVDLDPQKNYLICVFPHGLMSLGATFCFSSEALGFRELFPGIRPSFTTVYHNFMMPVFRELLLSVGACSASKESLNYLLSDPEGGRAAVLIVGGPAEALKSRANTYHLVLKERKGFVKVALRNGSPLVPAFSFGENDLYDQWANPKGSWVRWYQDQFLKVTGYAAIVPLGRRIFGFVPKRSPVNVVVGAPIEVEKVLDPSQEQIDNLHSSFVKHLTALFEQEKHNYIDNATNVHLVIE